MVTNAPQSDLPPMSDDHFQNTASFAETALKLGGKSEEEARRTGAIDKADDHVESLFQPQFQTVNSPVHRAIWDGNVEVDEWLPVEDEVSPDLDQVMNRSLEVVQQHREGNTLINADNKISNAVMDELGDAGTKRHW